MSYSPCARITHTVTMVSVCSCVNHNGTILEHIVLGKSGGLSHGKNIHTINLQTYRKYNIKFKTMLQTSFCCLLSRSEVMVKVRRTNKWFVTLRKSQLYSTEDMLCTRRCELDYPCVNEPILVCLSCSSRRPSKWKLGIKPPPSQ